MGTIAFWGTLVLRILTVDHTFKPLWLLATPSPIKVTWFFSVLSRFNYNITIKHINITICHFNANYLRLWHSLFFDNQYFTWWTVMFRSHTDCSWIRRYEVWFQEWFYLLLYNVVFMRWFPAVGGGGGGLIGWWVPVSMPWWIMLIFLNCVSGKWVSR